jgi:hypothetical protein
MSKKLLEGYKRLRKLVKKHIKDDEKKIARLKKNDSFSSVSKDKRFTKYYAMHEEHREENVARLRQNVADWEVSLLEVQRKIERLRS